MTLSDLLIVIDIDGTVVSEATDEELASAEIGPLWARRPFKPVARPHLCEFLQFAFESCRAVGVWTAASSDWFGIVYRSVLEPALRDIGRLPPLIDGDQGSHPKLVSTAIGAGFDFVWTKKQCRVVRPKPSDDPEAGWVFGGCEQLPARSLKPLCRMWRPDFRARYGATRDTTLIIDDTPTTYNNNYGNAISVAKYRGATDDQCLRRLIVVLRSIGELYAITRSVCDIDKRSWPLSIARSPASFGKQNCLLHRPYGGPRPVRTLVALAEFRRWEAATIADLDECIDEYRLWHLLFRSLLTLTSTLCQLVLDYVSPTHLLVEITLLWVTRDASSDIGSSGTCRMLTRRDHTPDQVLAALAVHTAKRGPAVRGTHLVVDRRLLDTNTPLAAQAPHSVNSHSWPRRRGDSFGVIFPNHLSNIGKAKT